MEYLLALAICLILLDGPTETVCYAPFVVGWDNNIPIYDKDSLRWLIGKPITIQGQFDVYWGELVDFDEKNGKVVVDSTWIRSEISVITQ